MTLYLNRGQRLTPYDRWDGNELFTRIFSDRATISGHDNPVFNNLADVQGSVNSRQMLSGFEEQESPNT